MQLVVCDYLCLADDIRKLSQLDQYTLLTLVEAYYDEEGDTVLGDFLNDYIQCLLEHDGEDTLHLDIQDVIDEHDLNEDMLRCVAQTIQHLYDTYMSRSVFVY